MAKRTAEQKRIRSNIYAQVYNKTGDSAIARACRDLSVKTIRERYGFNVKPTTTPKRKKVWTEKGKKIAKTNREKYTLAREQGATIEQAIKIKKFRKSNISKDGEYKKAKKDKKLSKEEKEVFWSTWSKKDQKHMPASIIDKARKINKSVKSKSLVLDKDAKYGYVVMYWSFMTGLEPEEISKHIEAQVFDKYIYTYNEPMFTKEVRSKVK